MNSQSLRHLRPRPIRTRGRIACRHRNPLRNRSPRLRQSRPRRNRRIALRRQRKSHSRLGPLLSQKRSQPRLVRNHLRPRRSRSRLGLLRNQKTVPRRSRPSNPSQTSQLRNKSRRTTSKRKRSPRTTRTNHSAARPSARRKIYHSLFPSCDATASSGVGAGLAPPAGVTPAKRRPIASAHPDRAISALHQPRELAGSKERLLKSPHPRSERTSVRRGAACRALSSI